MCIDADFCLKKRKLYRENGIFISTCNITKKKGDLQLIVVK